jgi:hypothetical protein
MNEICNNCKLIKLSANENKREHGDIFAKWGKKNAREESMMIKK